MDGEAEGLTDGLCDGEVEGDTDFDGDTEGLILCEGDILGLTLGEILRLIEGEEDCAGCE